MLGDGYCSELCSWKFWLFFTCQFQTKATPQGQAIHVPVRALLSTAAAAINAAPASRQKGHYTEVLHWALRHLFNEISN